jgi:hypothetical protein
MRARTCIWAIGLCACVSFASAAEGLAEAPADDVLGRIVAVQRAITTMQADFVKRTYNADAPRDPPEVMQGKFTIEVPDKYDLVFTKPRDPDWRQRFCSDGKRWWEVEGFAPDVEPSVKVKPVGDGDADIRRVVACARGDLTELRKDFALAALALPKDAGFAVTLTPSRPDVAHDLTRVRVALDSACGVKEVELEQPSGTRIVIAIERAVYDQPIPPGTFVVTER